MEYYLCSSAVYHKQVVKVTWHKTTLLTQMDGSIVFAWEGTVAPPGKYDWTCASFGQPESTTQMANRSVQPFLHSSWQKVPIFDNGRPFSPKFPFSWGIWTPSNSWFLEPDQAHSQNSISIGSAVFTLQVSAECPCTLHWVPLSRKIAPSHRGSGPPSNTWFLGTIRAHKPNGISIGSAVFAQMTAECPYTLQWDAPFPLKIALSHEGIWIPI